MIRIDLPFRKDHFRTVISKSETIENLWITCLNITKEMGFDYFSYSIQHPTSFTNPKTYIYGNYPFDTSCLLNRKNPHRTTGHFKIDSDHLSILSQIQHQESSGMTNLNDSIFFITQSTQKAEGILEHFLLARTHYEIDPPELKASRALIKVITKEIHKKLFQSNNAASQTAALSQREKEILLWGADGKTSEEIAIILDLSQDSVNFHHKTIQKKLGTTNRAQAIAHATAKGYI